MVVPTVANLTNALGVIRIGGTRQRLIGMKEALKHNNDIYIHNSISLKVSSLVEPAEGFCTGE